ncbi:T9SS type A sorting domain-containing protein [Epilithonimonas vandammei]|uniref:T9SS C-terminal target domain-containing protein n=1 Tax=Epilithonimonas vandammei TaxID=2487072 RepID=A0A3G8YCR8_9FLAO|nr:T9SS type A sorting domain-containing protein [Epilithonimonas vandammei]AZI38696.1 T9SS C-terminal target domain-containing protein [Epilithonimonas vandammei]
MKKQLLILSCFLSCLLSYAQNVNIPDANFKAYLVGNSEINTNGDDEIQVSEASAFTGEINVSNKGISLLWGIEYFTEITGLDCSLNSIQNLDLSTNKKLVTLKCSGFNNNGNPMGQIETLNVSQNTNLKTLICSGNKLTSLDVSTNLQLEYLDCNSNAYAIYENDNYVYFYLKNLDISKNINLKYLDCHQNQISYLDLENKIGLEYLDCSYNLLDELNVKNNLNLTVLDCRFNKISLLDISFLKKLEYLNCNSNLLENLNVQNNLSLNQLFLGSNKLTEIDISKNINLISFGFEGNYLSSIDLSKNINLTGIIFSGSLVTSFDISKNKKLETIFAWPGDSLTSLDVSQNPSLEILVCVSCKFKNLDLSKNLNLKQLRVQFSNLEELNLTNNLKLEFFTVFNNKLKKLNIKNLKRPNYDNFWFSATDGPDLKCIDVDDVIYANENWSKNKDSQTIYSTDCSATLATNETQKSQTKIFPNPVKNLLNVQTEAKLQKVEIYSSNGQLIKTSFLKETNVSTLPKGNYIVKITTDKGVQTEKIIKE